MTDPADLDNVCECFECSEPKAPGQVTCEDCEAHDCSPANTCRVPRCRTCARPLALCGCDMQG